ncbi:hypothetical protein C2857_007024 [Epichloe festucae Fl1]|uniref:DUF7918 domain-containing protein n=1 Tax=Epichloe festucae (strain Fl1) TaxID=877507 RepID=A0A7S9KQD4_EPIFF|nr:hypothetical protein C2857_007024 [Epichloe festucae Fl1]
MAILTQIPEIDVSVHVNGQPAKEYPSPCRDDDHTLPIPDHPSHECYIESKSGQTYTIEVTIAPGLKLPGKRNLGIRLSVDGKSILGRVDSHWDSSRPYNHSLIGPRMLSPKSKVHRRQKLTFSPVTTVEETAEAIIKRDTQISADLGTIVVSVNTCTLNGESLVPNTQNYKQEEGFTLAEKSMKGRELSHGTRFTEGPIIQPPTEFIVSHEQVFAQYTFRYRSRSALQNEMILPQTPPPQQSILDQIQAMTKDELRSLDEKLFRVKREKEINQETNSTPRLKRTIDLTDDDAIEVSGHRRIKAVKLEDGCEVVDLT